MCRAWIDVERCDAMRSGGCAPFVRKRPVRISAIPIRSSRTKWSRSWNKAGRSFDAPCCRGAASVCLTIACGDADNPIRLG